MTITVICRNCGSKLTAKEELVGQTRACPKCKQPVLVQAESEAVPITYSTPGITVVQDGPRLGFTGQTIPGVPETLEPRNRYYILNPDRIIAVWESGPGWQINVGNGFAPAKANVDAIPDQGEFAFVALEMGTFDEGGGPKSISTFKIVQRGALTALYRDENEVLKMIDSVCELTKTQKDFFAIFLRQQFMASTLANFMAKIFSEPDA